ncbi:MAG: hypothetical protein FJ011_06755 [Chloroflexi bacterium]|nr:hypothetical protein [Chloroflexota bacterium]
MSNQTNGLNTAHFFVDEAGDLNLFDRKGRVLLGQEGVSDTFMVGVAHVANVEVASAKLENLRAELLADPYFSGVPSMQPENRKTAIAFHAKNDLPEVRREVFKLLPTLGVEVQVAIRRKIVLVSEAQLLFKYGRKLHADDVYDDMVKRLFRNLLHRADINEIYFARRGKSDRAEALNAAISRAKMNFNRKWNREADKPTRILSAFPSERAGLQIVDYYLWALQRLYEMGEERFFRLVAGDYRLIMDLDDTRRKPYGEWYSDRNPLALEKIHAL